MAGEVKVRGRVGVEDGARKRGLKPPVKGMGPYPHPFRKCRALLALVPCLVQTKAQCMLSK